jgi:hypothetical protein
MSDVEKRILRMYDKSRPDEADLFETSTVNHWAWSLAAVFVFIAVWLAIALVNAENQRHALMTRQCEDLVFKGEIDKKCLVTIKSRDHWWEHLWYAVTNVRPSSD